MRFGRHLASPFCKLNDSFETYVPYFRNNNMHMQYSIHLPMKMEPIVSSETSAIRTQTPGNYPKRNNLQYSISLVPYLIRCIFSARIHTTA